MQPSLEFIISNYGLEEVAAPVHLTDVFARRLRSPAGITGAPNSTPADGAAVEPHAAGPAEFESPRWDI